MLGDPVNLVDPTGEIGILQALGIGVAIYFTVKTIYDGILYLKKVIHKPLQPLWSPQYHKQILDATEETRKFGKNVTWDVMSVGLPETKVKDL